MMSGLMKKTALLAILLLSGICPALAKGPQDVSKTIHNLSTTPHDDGWDSAGMRYGMYSTQEAEVCIFCHTPHGGSTTGPLWNRVDLNASGWTHYNNASLSSLLKSLSSRPVNEESLLCLSCHDGSIATNRVINPSNGTGEPINWASGGTNDTEIISLPGVWNRIGGKPGDEFGSKNLDDDHPISFSYSDVLNDPKYSSSGLLNDVAYATSKGVRFFSGGRVECSSCHDPHVNYDPLVPPPGDGTADDSYTPFLITSNAGSQLCLACHNK